MADIGQNIRRIRELKNLTQKSIASELEVSQKTLSNIEKSGNDISYSTIEKIAEILQVSITQVLELDVTNLLNNVSQKGGLSQLNSVNNNYMNSEQAKLYERLLDEKDKTIESLKQQIEKLI